MKLFSRRRIHEASASGSVVNVTEKNGVRILQLGGHAIHSAMRLRNPHHLELAYTRSMMAFLLFHPEPKKVLMIGLGGGSLVKYIHRNIPSARVTAIEIEPQVVAAARSYFFLPPDDDRLNVRIGDGAVYVEKHSRCADVILVDGFGEETLADELATQEFYDHCHDALTEDGILVVNLWGSDRRFGTFLERIEKSFDSLVLCLPAEERGNIIVFGMRKSPNFPKWEDLREKAKKLEAAYGLEFLKFVEGLKKMNLHSERRLLV